MDTISTTGAQQTENAKIQGTVVALYTLCGTFGALSCIWLGDLLGRRKLIFLSSFVSAIGCIIQSSAFEMSQFIVGRIILGLGTGGIIATVSVWQSELSKAETRGAHVTAFGAFCGMGNSLALWVGFGMSFTQPSSLSWRFTLALSIFLSILTCSTIFLLPESPRFVAIKGRWEEVRDTLARLLDVEPHSDIVNTEVENIRVSLERAKTSKLTDLFTMGRQRVFHRIVLASSVQIILQMTGVNIVVSYAPTIFEHQLHFDPIKSGVLAASSQAVLIIGSLCCVLTVDRLGRRKLMLFSAFASASCLAALAGLTAHPENKAGLKAAVFFTFFYYFVYVIGFFGIPFLYASEIAPTHLRAAVCGISTAFSWLYFIVYCVLNASFIPLIYFFFPETKGRTLEEIDEIFEHSTSVLNAVSLSKKFTTLASSSDSSLSNEIVAAKDEYT
ncbi:uncharacterized protein N7477_005263 [Penicillium maclennaniae]|uniref:uncharacterized protein n=1 Tax=Penicillium maclennaniae TaxID=1343394 RepID=UPI0025417189|nr:uncharacterized protein N7477_005263 [Penicillium maclennaniae]KAJ5669900.1 hypothetical protein N7477_005263 [Penicillium maclennaniae]